MSAEPTQSIRKSNRNKFSETENSKRKHWIVNGDPDDDGMNETVEQRKEIVKPFKKDYEVIPRGQSFSEVGKDDVLYIHCHGGFRYVDKTKPDLGYVQEDGQDKQYLFIKGYAQTGATPRDFIDFLRENGLKNDHEILKIAACNSDRFAKDLCYELAKNHPGLYPNLKVYGYEHQFAPNQGKRGGNLAGLVEPFVHEVGPKGNAHWELNEVAFTSAQTDKDDYQARKHRSSHSVKEQAEKLAQSQSASTAAAAAAPSNPSSASGSTFNRPVTRASARSSLSTSMGVGAEPDKNEDEKQESVPFSSASPPVPHDVPAPSPSPDPKPSFLSRIGSFLHLGPGEEGKEKAESTQTQNPTSTTIQVQDDGAPSSSAPNELSSRLSALKGQTEQLHSAYGSGAGFSHAESHAYDASQALQSNLSEHVPTPPAHQPAQSVSADADKESKPSTPRPGGHRSED